MLNLLRKGDMAIAAEANSHKCVRVEAEGVFRFITTSAFTSSICNYQELLNVISSPNVDF